MQGKKLKHTGEPTGGFRKFPTLVVVKLDHSTLNGHACSVNVNRFSHSHGRHWKYLHKMIWENCHIVRNRFGQLGSWCSFFDKHLLQARSTELVALRSKTTPNWVAHFLSPSCGTQFALQHSTKS